MATATPALPIPEAIARHIAALRARLTLWFWIDGIGRLLLGAIAIFAVDLAIDWLFRLDKSQRGVMWIVMLGAIGYIAYRRLLIPLTTHVGDDALLLAVEEKHKELGESVISAAQFARMPSFEHQGVSPAMVDATIRYGIEQANRINFTNVLNGQRFVTNVLLLLVGLALAIGLGVGVAMGGPLETWFNRNILLGDARWPQRTYLEIEGVKEGIVTLPRGENWTQIVHVSEDSLDIPDNVYIDFFPARGRPSQAMKRTGERQFEVTFTNVIEEFQFRARGGDAITEKVQVRLVEPPAVDSLQLTVTHPKYAGSTKEELPAGKGPYFVLKGSALGIRGIANKPLSGVQLLIEDPSRSDQEPVRIPLSLSAEDQFAGTLTPEQLKPGKYVLELTDAGGLTSKRPTTFLVNIKPDREPRFAGARLIGVSGMVVPKARIPYAATAIDDFQITKLRLGHRWRGETEGTGDGYTDPGRIAGVLPAQQVQVDDALELESLKLEPGTSLTLFLEAADNDDISGPNVGKSPDFLLRVVTEEQLRTDLLRREKEQRQELERLLKNQEDLMTEVAALGAAVRDASDITDEQRLTLMALQKRQNLLATNVGGVANVLESITDEVVNNRLEEQGGKLETRLREQIIAPLRQISEEDVDAAVVVLEKARRVSANAAERDPALAEVQQAQQKIADTIKEVLRHMEKAEGYQEAINLLYELEKAQAEVLERTEKEKQERINKILNKNSGSDKPEDKKPDEKKPDEPQDDKKADE